MPSRAHACVVAACLAFGLSLAVPAQSAELTPRALVELTDLSGIAMSPDARWAAFRTERPSIADNDLRLEWHVVGLDGAGLPRQVADGGRPIWGGAGTIVQDAAVWSPDSRFIYFRKLGPQGVQVWRARISDGRAAQVTADPADIRRFRIDPSGASLTYEVEGADRAAILAAEKAEQDSGIHIDSTIDVTQSLTSAVDINGRLASERLSGRWFERSNVLGSRAPRLKRLTIGSGSGEPIAGEFDLKSGSGEDRLVARRPDGGAIAFVRGWGRDSRLRWATAGQPGRSIACESPECARITSVAWRGNSGEIVFAARREGHGAALFGWDTRSGRTRPIAEAEALDHESGGGCAVGSRVAVCTVSSGSQPRRIEAIDLDTGAKRVLFDPNRPLVATFPQARWISWPIGNGRTAWGQLVTPAATGRAPLFVHYYDCSGFLKGGTGDLWPFHLFAKAGFAALCVQQLSPNEGEGDDNVAQYELGMKAVQAAIRHLDKAGIIDPKRVGMGGLSFGSEVAIWTAMNSDALAAVSIASPTLDPATYYFYNSLPGRDFRKMIETAWGLRHPDVEPGPWKRLSAGMNVDRLNAPILMQMPEQEYRYNVRLYTEMIHNGRAADMYAFPNERHLMAQPRHRLAIYRRNLDWFRFWLQGIDPADRNESERWKALRTKHCETIKNQQAFCRK